MATEDKSKRKVWRVVETKGLLKCYLARKEEFLNTRKKRNAYAHVLEDMVAQGFTDTSTTPVALEGKMRTLLSAFKCAKDNAGRTGATPCVAPYMEEMEEIFGNSALVANKHTLNAGTVQAQALAVPSPSEPAPTQQLVSSHHSAAPIFHTPFYRQGVSPTPATSHRPASPTRLHS
ncbi:uncharacterized protein LOC118746493 [Rhagoletis pomonella]|uniref:uncharacterized protein LOC118746493 n=1 Tax=Rhagoletis pomonella TaxID=28610 RepID=UPI00177EC7D9|nr:uncharacterized protein LOC118746493 [Rhagoletis pomonella]